MKSLKNKKVIVFGMGVSGVSSLKLAHALGAEVYAVNGGEISKWANLEVLKYAPIENCFHEGDQKLKELLSEVDYFILSPGIPREHSLCQDYLNYKKQIIGEIEFAYQVLKSHQELKPIIGITGTNGKTTTTTLIGQMIEDFDKSVFIGGNIGTPFADMAFEVIFEKKKYDFILLELSSFQLESIVEFHPQIAVLLNIFQNHGERYDNVEDYLKAKLNILNNMNQKDSFIYPNEDTLIKSQLKSFNFLDCSFNTQDFHSSINSSNYQLPGKHNLVNLEFACRVGALLSIDQKSMELTANQFRGVHFRIEKVDSKHPFLAFNDSKSTNWDATKTAIHSMENLSKPLYLIIGGKKRGHGDSISPIIELLNAKVKRVYLIGEMSEELYEEIRKHESINFEFMKFLKLEEAMNDVISDTAFFGTLLFSPGFPSFDYYKSYVDRGEHFNNLLK